MRKDKRLPSVWIVVGNFNGATSFYNGKPIIDSCLDTLKRTSYPNWRVVVVDGGSSDGSVEYVKRRFKWVSLLKDKYNVGFARSNNGGIKYAMDHGADYALLLNNDIIIRDKAWLSKLVGVAESDKTIGIVGCKLAYPNGLIQNAGMEVGIMGFNRGRAQHDSGQYDATEDVTAVSGGALMVKRQVVDRVGLLDGNFFGGYEDFDYCMMAKSAGFRVVYVGGVKLTHLEGFTSTYSKDESRRDWQFTMSQRNYVYFFMKNFGTVKRILAFFFLLASSIVSVESKDRPRGLTSIRLKSKPLWRLRVSISALSDGIKLYRARRKYPPTHFIVLRP